MQIRLPPASWHKQIDRIAPGACSGWDWFGPQNNSNGFIQREADLPPGTVIVSYDMTGKAFHGQAAAFVLLDGPLLYRVSLVPANEFWSTTLAPYVRPLLAMSVESRLLWVVSQLLDKFDAGRQDHVLSPSLHTIGSQMAAEVRALRMLYAGRLREHPDIESEYLAVAFQLWLSQQAIVTDKSAREVRTLLQQRCSLTLPTSSEVSSRESMSLRVSLD